MREPLFVSRKGLRKEENSGKMVKNGTQKGMSDLRAVKPDKNELFETMPVPKALAKMAIPTVVSQLITLIYNIADTWFIGQTDDPYMVAASSLVLTVFFMTTALANLFGVGGGSLVVRLLGGREEEEARKVASVSLVMAGGAALAFSLLCLIFMDPLLYLLGASGNTIGYARQYLLFVVVLGGFPTVLSNTMSAMLRNAGYSKEAGFGLGMGGILNVVLDPLFMFVLLPDGYEVIGAAAATMLSNCVAFAYFIIVYLKVQDECILALPWQIEKIQSKSMQSIFSVGVPSAMTTLLYDLTNMVINRLSSSHGDIELAAMGIVLKVERLPQNIGIGICLGMMPLAAYNYASKNHKRMNSFFKASLAAGLGVALSCVVLYRLFAPTILQAFITDAETVRYGTAFLKARCFASPVMFLSFHMVHFMQAIDRGKCSFWLAVIRQICLNIPILFLMNHFFGMDGIIWTQLVADAINSVISYIFYGREMRKLRLAP